MVVAFDMAFNSSFFFFFFFLLFSRRAIPISPTTILSFRFFSQQATFSFLFSNFLFRNIHCSRHFGRGSCVSRGGLGLCFYFYFLIQGTRQKLRLGGKTMRDRQVILKSHESHFLIFREAVVAERRKIFLLMRSEDCEQETGLYVRKDSL
ncbi:hypothetical protein BDP81DRAFT_413871 [Colletotrichum phormii]|uniref:Uncharacterized protein n=1 Tax=Colletotrichum phormii TaxID=359342 RepID=A0AAJ0A4W8_9PEZI|nr:uncharacterized protein BDP81DRAFT_413871 [Colletotrichum phormii]KAK1655958.1 hypothetical protein BDP81DRAFT_413871 [Colletotrichum phormii]